MSIHSVREWRTYILKRGVFGDALKFAHLQTTGEINRTSTAANRIAPSHAQITKLDGIGAESGPDAEEHCNLPEHLATNCLGGDLERGT